MSVTDFVALFISTYGIIFLHFAFAIFLVAKKRRIHYVAGFFMFDFGAMCAIGGPYLIAPPHTIPLILGVFATMTVLAPIGTVFAFTCLRVRENRKRLLAVVIAGTFVVFCGGLALIFLRYSNRIVFGIVYAWLLGTFIAMIAVAVRDLRPLSSLSKGIKFFFVLVCFSVLQVAVMFVATVFAFDVALFLAWALLIFCILAMTLSAFRSPQTYSLLGEQVTKNRYEKTKLGNVSVDVILSRLTTLMETEQLYLDQDLSLERLGKRLGMSAAQTSEILNAYTGKNLASYVNGYRIEYAKRALLSSDQSIIEIAFASGFNSKSVFNAAFQKQVGMSPSEFRRSGSGGEIREP
jgi:AraC-like DNA-binding protein